MASKPMRSIGDVVDSPCYGRVTIVACTNGGCWAVRGEDGHTRYGTDDDLDMTIEERAEIAEILRSRKLGQLAAPEPPTCTQTHSGTCFADVKCVGQCKWTTEKRSTGS